MAGFNFNLILMENNFMEKQKTAEHHTKAAQHLEKAIHHHKEAAKHCETGNQEKAGSSAHMAHAHVTHALHHTNEAAKYAVEHECKK